MFKLNPINFALLICASTFSISSFAGSDLQKMSDQELSDMTGQALMSLSYLAPTDSANPMRNISGSNNIGFYKLGLEAELSLNANIKNLQLGCAGRNGQGDCDIDIKNLSLSGLPDSYDSSGNPVFNNGRASTSASLTNPFIEFAISNPDKASTRQVTGLRLSAEKISALLTAGIDNGTAPSKTDGIQSLSGFMQIAATSGTAYTQQAMFGKSSTQSIGGMANLCVALLIGDCLGYRGTVHIQSDPSSSDTTGITVPSVAANFNIPAFTLRGTRQKAANLMGIPALLQNIPIASDGSSQYPSSMFSNDQLKVLLDCSNGASSSGGILSCGGLTALKSNAAFKMGAGSAIQNLNLNIDFSQSLSMFHNIPLTGTGGYLSLQSIPLLWPGATISNGDKSLTSLSAMSENTDVAQPGWWMSFAEPVQLGKLNVQQQIVLDDAVLAQVAARVTETLTKDPNSWPSASTSNGFETVGLLFGAPLASKVVADLGTYTKNNPVYVPLSNLQLTNQKVVTNCYGGLKFC